MLARLLVLFAVLGLSQGFATSVSKLDAGRISGAVVYLNMEHGQSGSTVLSSQPGLADDCQRTTWKDRLAVLWAFMLTQPSLATRRIFGNWGGAPPRPLHAYLAPLCL